MERAIAVKRIAKMLGKKFGYQIDDKAVSKEEREAAKVELKTATAERDRIGKAIEERRQALQKADAEYQDLLTAYGSARKRVEALNGVAYRYRITVGHSNELFFHVKAQGDSWEEVITQLKQEKQK